MQAQVVSRVRETGEDNDLFSDRIDTRPLVINNTDVDDIEDPDNTALQARTENSGIGWFVASLLIVNTALGGGLLNFPKAYHEAGGVVIASLVQGSLIALIAPALLILAYCSDYNGAKTMQEVLLFSWGKAGQRMCSICMSLYCFGTSITYLIIIGDQWDQFFAAVYDETFCHYWYMNRNFTMVLTSICFILPLCYPKKIDFLKHVSTVGVGAIIYVVLLIIYQYYTGNYERGQIKTEPDAWTDIFLVVPTLCFGYQCHVSIIPIYSCLEKRTVKNFNASVWIAIILCVFTYTVAASYGYLTFGSYIKSDILTSYNANYPSVLIANIAVAIKTYVTYPVNLFCGREAISDLWLDFSLSRRVLEEESHPSSPSEERFRRISIATVWFFTSLILAVILPNIGAVIKILGSLASLFIFVFPGLCLLRVSTDATQDSTKKVWLTIVAGLYLAIGAFIFGCVLSQGILYDFYYEAEVDIPFCKEEVQMIHKNLSSVSHIF